MGKSPRDLIRKSAVASQARGLVEGVEFLTNEILGHIPSVRLRTSLARRLLRLDIHSDVRLYRWREIRSGHQISIGRGSIIGFWAILDGRRGIKIGSNVNLSSEVALWTLQHDHSSPTFDTVGGPIIINDRAWVSFRATILPGVTIGEGAVVAAGAVVTRDVAPYTIVGGIPAKVIGHRNKDLSYSFDHRTSPWFV